MTFTHLKIATTSHVLLKKYKLNITEGAETLRSTSKSLANRAIKSSDAKAKVKHKSQNRIA